MGVCVWGATGKGKLRWPVVEQEATMVVAASSCCLVADVSMGRGRELVTLFFFFCK